MKKLKYDPEKTVIHSGFPITEYNKKYKQIWTEKINKNMCWVSKFLFRTSIILVNFYYLFQLMN